MEFFAFVGGIVGLVWAALLMRQGGLLAGALMVLLAGICFGHPFFHVAAGPFPLTIDRVLTVVLVLLTLSYRYFDKTVRIVPQRCDWLLLALVGWLTLSTFTHDWSSQKGLPVSQLVFYYLFPLTMYWMMRQVDVSPRALWGMYAVLGLFGIYLAFTSIVEAKQMSSLVFPKYITSIKFKEFFGRGRGPLLNPAGSGILQGLCLLAGLLWWPRMNRIQRTMLLGFAPVMLLGIYYTYTRSAWMGIGVGLLIGCTFTLPRSWRLPVVGGALAVSLVFLATNWEHLLSFKRDKELTAAETAESAKLRPILAMVAWEMFKDHPLFGCGFGQYDLVSLDYLSDRSIDLPLEKARTYVQHNSVLALLTQTGLVGAGLFIALLISWLRQAWHLWYSKTAPLPMRQLGLLFMAFTGVWFTNAMFQDVLIISMMNMLLLFFAGLTVNLASHLSEVRAGQRTEPAWAWQPAPLPNPS